MREIFNKKDVSFDEVYQASSTMAYIIGAPVEKPTQKPQKIYKLTEAGKDNTDKTTKPKDFTRQILKAGQKTLEASLEVGQKTLEASLEVGQKALEVSLEVGQKTLEVGLEVGQKLIGDMKEKQQFIDSVFGLIEKGSNLISEENKSVEKSVLIIGSTGSGKSTLLSYLKGDELVAKPIEDDFTEGFIIDYAQKKK